MMPDYHTPYYHESTYLSLDICKMEVMEGNGDKIGPAVPGPEWRQKPWRLKVLSFQLR